MELASYDIFTYHFGDVFRLYLRGQFAAHRNSRKVNMLWAECPHLGANLVRELSKSPSKQQLSVTEKQLKQRNTTEQQKKNNEGPPENPRIFVAAILEPVWVPHSVAGGCTPRHCTWRVCNRRPTYCGWLLLFFPVGRMCLTSS